VNPISVEQIEEARLKILANAQSLLVEAELLFQHHHLARTYTLAHLACEELAKLPMLVTIGKKLVLGYAVDWKKLNRRFRNHSAKINNLHTLDYMCSEIQTDDSDVNDYYQALSSTASMNDRKNHSLYVGISDLGVVAPADVINLQIAEAMLNNAKSRLYQFEQAEKIVGKITDAANSDFDIVAFEMFDRIEKGEFG